MRLCLLEKFCSGNAGKVTMFEFDNNNDEAILKKQLNALNDESHSKFRMGKHTETASLLMQFFILYSRNFKACSRNTVIIFFLSNKNPFQMVPVLTYFCHLFLSS